MSTLKLFIGVNPVNKGTVVIQDLLQKAIFDIPSIHKADSAGIQCLGQDILLIAIAIFDRGFDRNTLEDFKWKWFLTALCLLD